MIRTREDVLTDGMRRFTGAAAFPSDGTIGATAIAGG